MESNIRNLAKSYDLAKERKLLIRNDLKYLCKKLKEEHLGLNYLGAVKMT